MDVTILNTNLDAVSIVDTYESFIWTDRYYAYGDFELYEAMREGLLDYIKQDYYGWWWLWFESQRIVYGRSRHFFKCWKR